MISRDNGPVTNKTPAGEYVVELRSTQPSRSSSTRSLRSHLANKCNYNSLCAGHRQPATEKWRPKEGTYAEPGVNFGLRCGEFGDFIIELNEKSISGNEWSCKITKLTETAPGAIRLDMTCYDYNLAEFIKDPNPEKEFREIMLLRKIDGKSVFVRKTQNGKFKGPDWRASYCPEEAQRMHTEAEATNKAEAERKAAEEKLRLNPWRPRDGIYATPGTNFEDRCLKASDATIEFSERSISSGTDKCSVTFIRDEPDAIKLFANLQPGAEPTWLDRQDRRWWYDLRAAKLGNHHSEKGRRQHRLSAKEQERKLHRPWRTIVLLRPGRPADARSAKSQEVIECRCDVGGVATDRSAGRPAPHTHPCSRYLIGRLKLPIRAGW